MRREHLLLFAVTGFFTALIVFLIILYKPAVFNIISRSLDSNKNTAAESDADIIRSLNSKVKSLENNMALLSTEQNNQPQHQQQNQLLLLQVLKALLLQPVRSTIRRWECLLMSNARKAATSGLIFIPLRRIPDHRLHNKDIQIHTRFFLMRPTNRFILKPTIQLHHHQFQLS